MCWRETDARNFGLPSASSMLAVVWGLDSLMPQFPTARVMAPSSKEGHDFPELDCLPGGTGWTGLHNRFRQEPLSSFDGR